MRSVQIPDVVLGTTRLFNHVLVAVGRVRKFKISMCLGVKREVKTTTLRIHVRGPPPCKRRLSKREGGLRLLTTPSFTDADVNENEPFVGLLP